MHNARLYLSALTSISLLTALTACSSGSNGADSTSAAGSSGASRASSSSSVPGPMPLNEVQADPAVQKLVPAATKNKGTLTVAMDLHYPPTSFLAKDNSTPIGWNVDFARLIGKIMGLKVEIKNVGFDTIIPGIAANRFDFTATNMSATPERLKVLDMIGYWTDGSSLLVSKGNPEHLKPSSPSVCGHRIAVTKGTTQQQKYLPRLNKQCKKNGKEPADAVTLPNLQAALNQLHSKRVDGVFYDTPQLAWAAKQQPDLFTMVQPQYDKLNGTDVVCVGLKKDSPLTPAVKAAVQKAMAGKYYTKALNRWGLGSGAIKTATVVK